MKIKIFLSALTVFFIALGSISCDKDDNAITTNGPMLYIQFKFDKNQERLNNFGQPAAVAPGNAALSPDFNAISVHYFELAQTQNTQLGEGNVLYHAPETTVGGDKAIDFSQARIVGEGQNFLAIPLSAVKAGSYEWVRVSLSYQNYDISVRTAGVDYAGTLASFVGFNTYIGTHSINNSFFPVNDNRLQGYWAFALDDYPYSTSGQAPAGATTVPNPLSTTSPIPAGSCVVTGKFADKLVITGAEKSNIVLTLSLSVNNSFEWHEVTADGKYEPGIGENVTDMGLRGLIPSFKVVN